MAYVAVTRAKKALYFIRLNNFGIVKNKVVEKTDSKDESDAIVIEGEK